MRNGGYGGKDRGMGRGCGRGGGKGQGMERGRGDVTCDYNTEVKKGQVCAKIDPRPYQSVVNQNKANLDQAKAQLEKDKATLAYAELVYQPVQ